MLRYLLIALLVVIFDQSSKIYIKSFFDYHASVNIFGNFLKFTYIENPGIVFGLEVHRLLYYLITFFSFCIIIYIYYLIKSLYCENKNNNLVLISFSLILGGAVGNMIDRFFVIFNMFNFQGVIDFIDIGIDSYRFYIFNIADMSVSIGILLFVYYNYFIENNWKKI